MVYEEYLGIRNLYALLREDDKQVEIELDQSVLDSGVVSYKSIVDFGGLGLFKNGGNVTIKDNNK